MNNYKLLIVEDVKDTSDYIVNRIEKLCDIVEKIDQAYTLDEAYDLIMINTYDIVFLDIQMPTGTTFDLLNKLSVNSKIDFEIIFITGESAKEYTLNAIKYSALDFLYKPLDDNELLLAINKAKQRIDSKNHNLQVKVLLEHFANTDQNKSKKIAFQLKDGIVEMLHINDIIYLQADGIISHIFLTNGKQLTTNKNLGYYKDILINDFYFKQISNSLIVNSEYIKRYNHRELTLYLTDGNILYASKRFGKALKDELTNTQNSSGIKKMIKRLFKA